MVCRSAALAQRKASRTMSRVWPLRMTFFSIQGSPFSTPKPTRLAPAAFIRWKSSGSVWLTFMPCTVVQGTVFRPSSTMLAAEFLGPRQFQIPDVVGDADLGGRRSCTSQRHSATTFSTLRPRQVSPVTGLEQKVHL